MLNQIKQILAEIIEADVAQIPDDANMDNTPGWDSLANLRLVMNLEETFQQSFEPADIVKMTSIQGIFNILEKK